jgi:hypothetical protein
MVIREDLHKLSDPTRRISGMPFGRTWGILPRPPFREEGTCMPDLHPHHEDHPDVVSRTARRGLILFLIYFALYAGFLLLNIFAPSAMQDEILPIGKGYYFKLHGLNLALVYGLFLILAAVLLAFLYMRLTRTPRQ